MIRHGKKTLGRASDRVPVAAGLFVVLCGCGASAPDDTGAGGKAGTQEAHGSSIATRGSGSDGVEGHFDVATPAGDLCEDGECSIMDISAIKAKLPIGVACTADAQCASGHCVDGICCDTFCFGPCQACTALKKGSGVDGTCGPIAAQTDPDHECSTGICNGFGACAKVNGIVCIRASECASNLCIDGNCCATTCNGTCMACSIAKRGGGDDGQCGPIRSGLDPDNECALSCDGTGACQPSLNGVPCLSDAVCLSGHCVEGICCDTDCSGNCEACTSAKKGGGSDGTCGFIATNTDPDSECSAGHCDGAGVCTTQSSANGVACTTDPDCGSDHCVDGVCCSTACTSTCFACNVPGSEGTCSPAPEGQSDPNSAPACTTECYGAGQCRKNTGDPCTSGLQCMSRICNNLICDPPRTYSGPLQWLTITSGYIEPYQIAALNNGQGVVIVGEVYGQSFLNSTHSADGVFTWGTYGDANAQYGSWLWVARGGIYAYWEALSRYCPWPLGTPCQYTCTTTSPSGNLGHAAYLAGKNDAGHIAWVEHVGSPSYNSCYPWGSGFSGWDRLKRYDPATGIQLNIPVPAGLQPPIILGPAGEFHWGPATNLRKTDVNAVVQWTKTPTVAGTISSSGWDVDNDGSILIAVSFSGSIDYGAGPMTATGSQDLGLIKLDPKGNVDWQRHFGAMGSTVSDVKVSRTGTSDWAVYGSHTGTVDLGAGPLTGTKFVVKYDASGNALWHVDIVSAVEMMVAGDVSGAVYVGGPRRYGTNNTDFGWGVITNAFMAKYQ